MWRRKPHGVRKGRCKNKFIVFHSALITTDLLRRVEFAVFFFQRLYQLPGLERLDHDVRTPRKFSVDVQLRDGRPAREFLDRGRQVTADG